MRGCTTSSSYMARRSNGRRKESSKPPIDGIGARSASDDEAPAGSVDVMILANPSGWCAPSFFSVAGLESVQCIPRPIGHQEGHTRGHHQPWPKMKGKRSTTAPTSIGESSASRRCCLPRGLDAALMTLVGRGGGREPPAPPSHHCAAAHAPNTRRPHWHAGAILVWLTARLTAGRVADSRARFASGVAGPSTTHPPP